MLNVMEVSATRCGQVSVNSAPRKQKFVDMSTWNEIVCVLEQSNENERRFWFSAENDCSGAT